MFIKHLLCASPLVTDEATFTGETPSLALALHTNLTLLEEAWWCERKKITKDQASMARIHHRVIHPLSL